jgi:hypothetical protein
MPLVLWVKNGVWSSKINCGSDTTVVTDSDLEQENKGLESVFV